MTGNNELDIQTSENKKYHNILGSSSDVCGRSVDRSIKNLLAIAKLAKSKKSTLLKNFVKANSFCEM